MCCVGQGWDPLSFGANYQHIEWNSPLQPGDHFLNVVPGSHRRRSTPEERAVCVAGTNGDVDREMPGGIAVRIEPGDVAYFDAGILHRGWNPMGETRWTLHNVSWGTQIPVMFDYDPIGDVPALRQVLADYPSLPRQGKKYLTDFIDSVEEGERKSRKPLFADLWASAEQADAWAAEKADAAAAAAAAAAASSSSTGSSATTAAKALPKVLTVCFNHETNTFSSTPTTLDDFKFRGLLTGEDIAAAYRGTSTELGGFIDTAEEVGVQLVHTVYARAQPAGLVSDEVVEFVWAELSKCLDAHPDTAGVLLALHGALILQSYDDGEGLLLSRLRSKVGPDLPVVATLDLHAHLSEAMVASADALIGYKTYPHVDYVDRAAEATKLIAKMIRGESKPAMAAAKPPMIPMVPKQFTGAGAAKEFITKLQQLEQRNPDVISATLLMGFPWADIPDMGAAFIVVTEAGDDDDDGAGAALAQQLADELAAELWERRDEFMPELLTPAEAVDAAVLARAESAAAGTGGPVVLADMSDNPGGGGASDSVAILSEFLSRGVDGVAVGAIVDMEVVGLCEAAGVGQTLTEPFTLGGKHDRLHGSPLAVGAGVATVVSLSDGSYVLEGAMMTGSKLSMGPTAVIELCSAPAPGQNPHKKSTKVIVSSYRQQVLDPCILRKQGIEPLEFDYVVLKSAVHYRSNFTELASAIVEVTGPGIHSSRVTDFEYKRVDRPLWPLDGSTMAAAAARL
eukprot:SAG22_NODE_2091_length_3027_cov_1.473702_1_plen_738_part_00